MFGKVPDEATGEKDNNLEDSDGSWEEEFNKYKS